MAKNRFQIPVGFDFTSKAATVHRTPKIAAKFCSGVPLTTAVPLPPDITTLVRNVTSTPEAFFAVRRIFALPAMSTWASAAKVYPANAGLIVREVLLVFNAAAQSRTIFDKARPSAFTA